MSEQEEKAIELGGELQRFLNTNLGVALLTKAAERRLLAMEKLGYVDPTDAKAVADLQNEVKLADRFEGWLQEIEHESNAALAAREAETFTDPIP